MDLRAVATALAIAVALAVIIDLLDAYDDLLLRVGQLEAARIDGLRGEWLEKGDLNGK